MKVGPCMSGTGLAAPTPPETPSATSSVASVTPMVIYPPVSALPTHMMSGDTSACSQAKSLAALGVQGVEVAVRVQGVEVQREGGGGGGGEGGGGDGGGGGGGGGLEVEVEAEGEVEVEVAALRSLARAAEASGDAVEDEQHAVLVAQPPHSLQVGRAVHAHAARPLHDRLEDHRSHLAGGKEEQEEA